MNEVLRDSQVYIAYLDSLQLNMRGASTALEMCFQPFKRGNLTLNLAKCQFGLQLVEHLGYVVGNG